jgi:ABC-type uncharacterized transport system involved in gliding motility auxiliary subunit
MSKAGRISLILGFLFLIASGGVRILLGVWHDSLYVSLGLGAVLILAGFILDRAFYREFFTMRTTKNGLAMGWVIILAFAFLFCLNFLSIRYDKKWDWTSEGINSLSEQSVKIVNGLKEPVEAILLFRKDPEAENVKRAVADLLELYREKNKNIKFASYNALERPDLAQKYDFRAGTSGLYIEYKGKHLKVDQPTEEAVTKTLLKLTRENKKVIYVTQGHGERALDSEKPESMGLFKEDLETSYAVTPLTLIQTGSVPADAAAVLVIGPTQDLLPTEIAALRTYASNGGHLLLASDPGEKNNMAQLDKIFGVEFDNDYVLDPRASIPGAGNVAALGTVYSTSSEITKTMGAQPTLFLLASSIHKAPGAPADFKFETLVSTNEVSRATNALAQDAKLVSNGPHTIAIQVTGKIAPPAPAPSKDKKTAEAPAASGKEFSAIIIGDTDFLANQLFQKYANRDFVMNSVASLAKDEDMISIRPKQPKGSVLELHGNRLMIVIFGFLLPLPLLLFLSSGVIWFRRRTA